MAERMSAILTSGSLLSATSFAYPTVDGSKREWNQHPDRRSVKQM